MTEQQGQQPPAGPIPQQWAAPPPGWTPPPGYPAPAFQVVHHTKTNGLAIAAMVLGIVWIYWLGSLLAVIFGHVALSQIGKSGGAQTGRGMAIAGVVLGYVGLGIFLLLVIVGASIGG
jgi:hypothetical protein